MLEFTEQELTIWKEIVEKANSNLKSDCPLIEDEVIIKVDRYIKYLEYSLSGEYL